MSRIGVKGWLAVATAASVTVVVIAVAAISDMLFRSQLEGALVDAAVIETVETFDSLDVIGFEVGSGVIGSNVVSGEIAIRDLIRNRFLDPAVVADVASRTAGGADQLAVAVGWDAVILTSIDGATTAVVEGASVASLDGPAIPDWMLFELAFSSPEEITIDGNEVVIERAALERGRFVTESFVDQEVLLWIDTSDIDAVLGRIQRLLLAAAPLLAALGAGLAWILGSRALNPIGRMTAEVARIDANDLSRRMPVPAANDEVGELAMTMNHMLDRVELSHEAQRRFVADASHELRSPVSILKHESELAMTYPDRFELGDLAALTNAEANRLGAMVDDLLVLAADEGARRSQGSDGDGPITDLDEVVLAEAARPRPVPIDTSQVSAGRVRGRPDQLSRAVSHLLDNACRHASNGVAVGVETSDGEVTLTVADDGAGVHEADRERIFDRFVRLDEARTRDQGGAGLGLAVVKAIVQGSGGHVEVAESAEGGALFTVRWPSGDGAARRISGRV